MVSLSFHGLFSILCRFIKVSVLVLVQLRIEVVTDQCGVKQHENTTFVVIVVFLACI